MFPYIAAQINDIENYKNYAVVHGSALNFTVKKHKRFVPYALKGLEATNTIIVDSKHAYDEFLEFLEEEEREENTCQECYVDTRYSDCECEEEEE